MTVITLAKRGTVSTSFGSKSLVNPRGTARSHRASAISFTSLAAAISVTAIVAITILGIHATIFTLAISKNAPKIQELDRQTELLQVEVMTLSSPQILTEQARALQLVENTRSARHITLTLPKELAVK